MLEDQNQPCSKDQNSCQSDVSVQLSKILQSDAEQNLSSDQICAKLFGCNSDAKLRKADLLSHVGTIGTIDTSGTIGTSGAIGTSGTSGTTGTSGATGPCGICQMHVQTIRKALENNSNMSTLVQILDGLCSVLPGPSAGLCVNFLNTYGAQIIQLVIGLADDTQICQSFGQCGKLH